MWSRQSSDALRVTAIDPDKYKFISDDYLYDLIRSFGDSAELERAAVGSAFICRNNIIYNHNTHLLAMLYRDGNTAAGDRLEEIYAPLYAKFAALTDKPTFDIIEYMCAAIALAFAKGGERMVGLLRDIGTIYDKNTYSKIEFIPFCSNMLPRYGDALKNALVTVRAEKGSEFAFGDFIDHFESEYCGKRRVQPRVTFDEYYMLVKDTDEHFYHLKTEDFTAEQRLMLAGLYCAETEPSRKSRALNYFCNSKSPWLLDPAILIDEARRYEKFFVMDKTALPEFGLANALIIALSLLRADTVHDYAVELIGRGYIPHGLQLWTRNLRPGEREEFERLFKQLDYVEGYCVYTTFAEACEEGYVSSPDELLLFAYENSHIDIRIIIVKELFRQGFVNDALTKEFRFDAGHEVRRAADLAYGDKK